MINMPEIEPSTNETVENGTQANTLLQELLNKSRVIREYETPDRIEELLNALITEISNKTISADKSSSLLKSLDCRIAEIDALLSNQVNEVMHQPEFQKLEASWRGLKYLVDESDTGVNLKIKVLNVDKETLLANFQAAEDKDQSALFKKVYEEEYGTSGGAPFAAIIGDYEFSRAPKDIELLTHISKVASAAHSPFIAAASPELFGKDSFSQLRQIRDIELAFDGPEYIKWNSYRESEDSRYVGLTMPNVLGRLPYGPDTVSAKAFNFIEETSLHQNYLWTNAAYALGSRLSAAFKDFGWCVAIRGAEGGGKIKNLPVHNFTDAGMIDTKCPTEISLTFRQEFELSKLGLIPLVYEKGTDSATFFSVQSTQKPGKYDNDSATANAALSAQLQYIMATSRIAHYMKALLYEKKIGSFSTAQGAQDILNNWIEKYVLKDDEGSPDQKAKRPLREANIEVVEIPGKPGNYRAVAFLRPHFQLDGLTMSMRLVADLPNQRK